MTRPNTETLRRALDLSEQIDSLNGELDRIGNPGPPPTELEKLAAKRFSEFQEWEAPGGAWINLVNPKAKGRTKRKGTSESSGLFDPALYQGESQWKTIQVRRPLSVAHRAKLAAAQRKRWKKQKKGAK